MRIAIYCRVSSEEQKTKGISILDQEERGKSFCVENGYDFEIFNDAGLSGELNPEDRPGLNSLLEKIYLNEIHGIYVVDFDRLTRDEKYGFVLKKILIDNNIKLYDTSGLINLNDETQDLLLGIKILLSSFELKKLRVRIKRNLERSIEQGRVNGGPLITYGYTKGEDKKLIIDEIESDVVNLIFQLAIQGKGTKVIANELNDRNIPTKRSTAKNGYMMVKGERKTEFLWRDSVVYRILTNKIYYGVRTYKGKEYPSPPIITKEKFDLVQSLLKKRSIMKDTTNKYFYLLKGLLYCECGCRFYGLKRADLSSNYYGCSSQRHRNEWCKSKGINIDFLDKMVLEQIQGLPNDIIKFFDWYENNDMSKFYMMQLASARTKEKTLSQRIENLLELGLDGKIKKDVFNDKMEKLNTELENAIEDKKKYLKQFALPNKKKEITGLVLDIVQRIKNEKNLKQKREYLRGIIDKIHIQWIEEKQRHTIFINYKIDNLTEYKLQKDLEFEYSKAGYRIDKRTTLNQKLIIKKFLSDSNEVIESPMVQVL